ncbi:hypothetical protein FRC05_010263 [Tulasnella sp. 425]|nr:hypothetical protein FRC05_010263 [Tulasnella sp. 425]
MAACLPLVDMANRLRRSSTFNVRSSASIPVHRFAHELEQSQKGSTAISTYPVYHIFRIIKSSHDPPVGRLSPTSDISDYYSDVDDGGDLNRFAANFRTLVERVSRETEDGARLPAPIYNLTRPQIGRTTPPTAYAPRRSPSPRNSGSRRSSFGQDGNGAGPSSPPPQGAAASQAESHAQMQHDLLQAHRLMLLEQAMRAESYEHVVVLGGAVRRMSTIASVADQSERGEPPWTPTSGASSYATPMELTRSPTSSTARSGRRNPMSRHTVTPPPGVGLLTDSFQSERGHYTD